MTVNYLNTSLYGLTPQIANIVNYLDFWVPPTILSSINDTLLLLPPKYHLKPDLLSFDTYGTTGYWWVFMMRNPDIIQDPIWDFVNGIQIYLPIKGNLPRTTNS